jgi:hypothetical protein
MSGITLKIRNLSYHVDAKQHRRNQRRLRQLPQVLDRIPELAQHFVGKPQFIVERRGSRVSVMREDHRDELQRLIDLPEESYSDRLSLSEWRLETEYGGQEELVPFPITLHDVYEREGVTIKTGNPHSNNAGEEFFRALHARFLGVVEAKSPIGFSFDASDLYGVKNPGRMFYKHMAGQDLAATIKRGNQDLLNWALWESGKFFSRLLHARLYLEDSDRIGNYFIEDNPATKVFRFLDLERVSYRPVYSNEQKAEMLSKFILVSLNNGFITPERLGEFVIVCLGSHSRSPALVEKLQTLGA